jgi:hypothetical protein
MSCLTQAAKKLARVEAAHAIQVRDLTAKKDESSAVELLLREDLQSAEMLNEVLQKQLHRVCH